MTLHAERNGENITVQFTYGPVTARLTEHRGHVLAFWHDLSKLVIDDTEDRAKAGYERYTADCGGLSVHGEQLPPWDGLPGKIRGHWIAAFTE